MTPPKVPTNVAGVAVCQECKSALEVVCPNGHDAEAFEVASDTAAELRRALAAARTEIRSLIRQRDQALRAVERVGRGIARTLPESVRIPGEPAPRQPGGPRKTP